MNLTEQRLAEAYELATESPDKSNQNGAVIYSFTALMSSGVNHFYPGITPTDERPEKYERIVHAELDACLGLADCSLRVTEHTAMYCPWATCKPCAISILGSRIPTLVLHFDRCLAFVATRGGQDEKALADWQPDIDESMDWLKDGGCEIEVFRGPVPFDGVININGRPWSPQNLEFTDA